MSNFLKQWDKAIAEAQQTGECVTLYKQNHMLDEPRPVARTMHPSFMGIKPPKHDPVRDKWVRPEGYTGPNKKASPRCESGGHDFCTCDVCF